jgi:hypothetical protein
LLTPSNSTAALRIGTSDSGARAPTPKKVIQSWSASQVACEQSRYLGGLQALRWSGQGTPGSEGGETQSLQGVRQRHSVNRRERNAAGAASRRPNATVFPVGSTKRPSCGVGGSVAPARDGASLADHGHLARGSWWRSCSPSARPGRVRRPPSPARGRGRPARMKGIRAFPLFRATSWLSREASCTDGCGSYPREAQAPIWTPLVKTEKVGAAFCSFQRQ